MTESVYETGMIIEVFVENSLDYLLDLCVGGL